MDLQMVVSDLDGTLLNNNRNISTPDHKMLKILGEKKICRVIATGRSLYSVNKVLDAHFPIDYLIFSSGAGIMNWATQKIIRAKYLTSLMIEKTLQVFIANKLDFMVHLPIPKNHYFYYYASSKSNPDFRHRIRLYQKFAKEFKEPIPKACQLLAIFAGENKELFASIRKQLSFVNVIRATSPLDGKSLWMEIFPNDVCKGLSSQWLLEHLGIDNQGTFAIGNDYNDLDLLRWAKHAFVVKNSPAELQKEFSTTASNENHGFTQALSTILG